MKKILNIILIFAMAFQITANAQNEPEQLYAQSAVVIDADSGRILFGKNEREKRPMASTTKIMTCILALESGNGDDIAVVSKNAVKQPRVHLGACEGERFRMEDLLYSLMLSSHNDSAVVIAEHLSGTIEKFAEKMNEKAKEIGCTDTYFITPNGLDAVNGNGKHSTTAYDLAKIMRYCIMQSPKREEFLQITRRDSYEFSNTQGTKKYRCKNHNAFLNMMDGALSGKTGFTGGAGYCYVGALRREDRTFIVALLGCGWPDHKNYKWQDTKKLMQYALDQYRYRQIQSEALEENIVVKNAAPDEERLRFRKNPGKETKLLIGDHETFQTETELKKEWKAPIEEGEHAGWIKYYINKEMVLKEEIVTANKVDKITYHWCIRKVMEKIFV